MGTALAGLCLLSSWARMDRNQLGGFSYIHCISLLEAWGDCCCGISLAAVQSQFKMTINQNGCVYSFCTGISVRLCVLPWLREDVLLSLKLFSWNAKDMETRLPGVKHQTPILGVCTTRASAGMWIKAQGSGIQGLGSMSFRMSWELFIVDASFSVLLEVWVSQCCLFFLGSYCFLSWWAGSRHLAASGSNLLVPQTQNLHPI